MNKRGRPKGAKKFQEKDSDGQIFEFANDVQRNFALCSTRESLCDGGVGSGKTIGGIIKLLLLAEHYPGSRWFVARQTYKDLCITTRKTFQRFCPASWITRDVQNEIELFNGSEIIWAHLDEYDIKTLMGLEINGSFLDQAEEINPEVYEILESRAGRWQLPSWSNPCPAYTWSTSNPQGHDWLYFRFHPECNPPENRSYFFAPTGCNKEILDKYHPGYYDNLMKKSPSWRRRWIEGLRDIWEGQIFPEFNKKVHTYNPQKFNPFQVFPQGAAWAFMDYGLQHPTTFGTTWTTQPGYVFFTSEWGRRSTKDKTYTIKDNATEIRRLRDSHQQRIRGIYGDPSMFFESTRDRRIQTTSVAAEYRSEGVYLLKADNNDEASLEIIHELLHVKEGLKNPVTGENHSPHLFISEDCVNLINEIGSQSWDEGRNPNTGEKEFLGTRNDRIPDDYFDLLRYFANSKIHQVTVSRPKMKIPGYGWTLREHPIYA